MTAGFGISAGFVSAADAVCSALALVSSVAVNVVSGEPNEIISKPSKYGPSYIPNSSNALVAGDEFFGIAGFVVVVVAWT